MKRTYILKTDDPSLVMKFFRERSGLEKIQIARKLGVTRPTLDNIENRPNDIGIKYIEKLVAIYGDDFADYFIANKLYSRND